MYLLASDRALNTLHKHMRPVRSIMQTLALIKPDAVRAGHAQEIKQVRAGCAALQCIAKGTQSLSVCGLLLWLVFMTGFPIAHCPPACCHEQLEHAL